MCISRNPEREAKHREEMRRWMEQIRREVLADQFIQEAADSVARKEAAMQEEREMTTV